MCVCASEVHTVCIRINMCIYVRARVCVCGGGVLCVGRRVRMAAWPLCICHFWVDKGFGVGCRTVLQCDGCGPCFFFLHRANPTHRHLRLVLGQGLNVNDLVGSTQCQSPVGNGRCRERVQVRCADLDGNTVHPGQQPQPCPFTQEHGKPGVSDAGFQQNH